MVKFMCLIFDKILSERVGNDTNTKLTITNSLVYIQEDPRVDIQVSTHPCSWLSSSKTKDIFGEIKVKK